MAARAADRDSGSTGAPGLPADVGAAHAREMLAENGSKAFLEVDGGIDRKTIKSVWEAGADTFVAGNAIFGAKNPKAEIAELRARCTAQA